VSDDFRLFAFGKQIGPTMNAEELERIERSIRANTACGLANPWSYVVEKRGLDGWRVARVVDDFACPELFANPEAA
jgi:hypothetical protein